MALRPFAAIDPRRLDNPDTKGINTVTGQTLKSLEQTQATSPNVPPGVANGINAGFGAGASEFGEDAPTATMDAGAGATDDGTTAGIQDVINQQNSVSGAASTGTTSVDNGYIRPTPNILDQFYSYSYRASVYLMSPEQYKAMSISKKKTVNGFQLLFQSGGAPNNSGGVAGGVAPTNLTQNSISTQADAGRNPAFPVDFYIDSITLETLSPGPGSRAAHAVKNLKFTVIEPSNISLIDRLDEAVQSCIGSPGGKINYNAPTYLMVIRWYGYDQTGKLIPGITGAGTPPSDSNAVIEKFIPFRITKLNWGIKSNLVKYDFEGLAFGLDIAASTRRGTIPYDIELTAESIGKLLGGDATYSGTASPNNAPGNTTTTDQTQANDDLNAMANVGNGAPPKANAAPNKKTLRAGLMEAMNQFQRDLVKQQKYEVPDTYRITFVNAPDGTSPIENATIVPPGKKVEKSRTPMSAPAAKDASSLDQTKSAVNDRAKSYTVTAGQQIIQILDLAIRNSTYILDQALTVEIDNESVLNPQKIGSTVYWYNITMNAIPKLPYDNLRNDFAYDIEFVVSPYVLQDFNSKFFPLTRFRGVHKSYPYWFTGKNTAVLDYEESMNNTYNITITGTNPKNSKTEKERRALQLSMREQPFYSYQSGSTESRQGSDGKDYEPSASAAEYLYDPKGLANGRLKIIGDPSWIHQGSFAGGVSTSNFSYKPFLPDGTINYDASQVMFEIVWQRPEDYDLTTGQADPYKSSNNKKRQPVQSRVYTLTQVTSEFHQGKFQQTLQGRLFNFPKTKNPNNKSVSTSVPAVLQPTSSDADAQEGGFYGDQRTESQTPETQTNRATLGSADEYSDYGSSSGVGAAGTSILVSAPILTKNSPKVDIVTTPSIPITPNSGAADEKPPAPATSNGIVAETSSLPPPNKIGQADIRAIDNAIASNENLAAFGRYRSPTRKSPQIIAQDDQ